ncbi:MAG: tRNA (guanosine(37)-N1)-methyltransferase TrmD [Pseudomonadota bacterium]
MRIGVVTLFPEAVSTVTQFGVVGRAAERGLVELLLENPRDYAGDVHRTVDDRPYGGGPGMVMRFEPLAAAIEALRSRLPDGVPVFALSPQGRRFDQATAERLAALEGFGLVAGRYEGMDERVIETCVDDELSLGDFVVSGGELPAMLVTDAVIRLLPGVLGDAESAREDSFTTGLLDCPHYTRPEETGGLRVPDVLLSGDHRRIARWREQQALGRTYRRRPDLLVDKELTAEQQALLEEYLQKYIGSEAS